jgi:S-adenosylmethionine decarboxylase
MVATDFFRSTEEMPNLAPGIHRQRLVVEGTCPQCITEGEIRRYLAGLSDVCDMRRLIDPVTHRSEKFGWAGWVHWEESGAHFYAWETPMIFFSVDIYTCKPFNPDQVLAFTSSFFQADRIVGKEF